MHRHPIPRQSTASTRPTPCSEVRDERPFVRCGKMKKAGFEEGFLFENVDRRLTIVLPSLALLVLVAGSRFRP